jgi:hypothetical protein
LNGTQDLEHVVTPVRRRQDPDRTDDHAGVQCAIRAKAGPGPGGRALTH